jgi:4-oxalocrotonate tautomerase
MPIIQFNLLEGRTVDQKRAMARRVTEVVCETLSVKPENVRILIHEMGPHDFSVGGVCAADNGKMPAAAVNGVNGHAQVETKTQ